MALSDQHPVRDTDPLDAALAVARLGGHAGWTALYDAYSPALRGYLSGRGCREPDDVLGEVWLQAVRDLERFSGNATDLRRWLFTMARNRMVDASRYWRRRPVVTAPPDVLDGAADDDTATMALDRVADAAVVAALATLTADQRDVLLLRVFAGMTAPEIAEVVGKRPGAVKQLQRRGLEQLRRHVPVSASVSRTLKGSEGGGELDVT